MNKTALDLQQRLLALIARGVAQPTSDVEFNELAGAIFAFQHEHCGVYRAYCEQQKCTPHAVEHWKQIPAVPTSAFKDFTITCFPAEDAVAEFHTSGTTREKAGRHFFYTLGLYDAAIKPNFAAYLLPDLVAAVDNRGCSDKSDLPRLASAATERWRMFILTQSPQEAPHSSLSHMMGVVMRAFGTADSGYFMESGALCTERVIAALQKAQTAHQAVFLLGTAFAFVHLFDHLAQQNLRFDLTDGSRAMETGGFKGRSREVSKKELYAMFEKFLGIPTSRVVNEYGMTELSTQFYDQTLVGRLCESVNSQSAASQKRPTDNTQTDRKVAPPWSRVLIIDPNTGKEAKEGERGLIRIYDLANLWSVMCIQTEDLGVARDDGFEILGRAAGAEVRGCSLNAEALKM